MFSPSALNDLAGFESADDPRPERMMFVNVLQVRLELRRHRPSSRLQSQTRAMVGRATVVGR